VKAKDVSVSTIKKQRINRTREQWRDLVWEQRRSGLSLQAFCRQVSASTTAFARWRKHFAEVAEPRTKAKALSVKNKPVLPERDVVVAHDRAAQFVEIAAPMRPLDSGIKIRLELGGGIVLELVRA
jgi:hypothetical protein